MISLGNGKGNVLQSRKPLLLRSGFDFPSCPTSSLPTTPTTSLNCNTTKRPCLSGTSLYLPPGGGGNALPLWEAGIAVFLPLVTYARVIKGKKKLRSSSLNSVNAPLLPLWTASAVYKGTQPPLSPESFPVCIWVSEICQPPFPFCGISRVKLREGRSN